MELAILNRLVEAIYTDGRIRQLLTKLKPSDLMEDLLHHFVERLYQYNEKHPEKLFILASHDRVFCKCVGGCEEVKQELFAWVVGNLKMELMSPRSPFSRKYRKVYSELPNWMMGVEWDGVDKTNFEEDKSRIDRYGSGRVVNDAKHLYQPWQVSGHFGLCSDNKAFNFVFDPVISFL